MADAEKIKESLKNCYDEHLCHKCLYQVVKHNLDGVASCTSFLARDALKLIDEQQEEIKRLRTQLDEAMLWR